MTLKNNEKSDRASRKKSNSNITQLEDLFASLPTELRHFSNGSLKYFQWKAILHRWITDES